MKTLAIALLMLAGCGGPDDETAGDPEPAAVAASSWSLDVQTVGWSCSGSMTIASIGKKGNATGQWSCAGSYGGSVKGTIISMTADLQMETTPGVFAPMTGTITAKSIHGTLSVGSSAQAFNAARL